MESLMDWPQHKRRSLADANKESVRPRIMFIVM